jgi:HAD superfamily hydrolase (TIGR01509 family)
MNSRLIPVPAWAHSIQAVAFDMDGLLVNTEEVYTQVGEILMKRRGREFTRKLKNDITGLPGPTAFALMIERESLSDSVEQLASESKQIFGEILPSQLRLLTGVLELLDRLDRDGRPKCVATSSTHEFSRIVLGQTGILERFQFVITASDVEHGKPHPDIYQAAAQRMGVEPRQMMVLEDSHHGCRAGITSGACTVAVPGPHSVDHDFRGVHFQAESLLDPRIDRLLSVD